MDQKLYQKMFDQVRMPARRAEQIRSELAARRIQDKLEVTDMMNNRKTSRRPMAALIAVCAVAVLTVTAFASGGKMFEHVFQMMTMSGPAISQGIDEEGNYFFDGGGTAEPVSPVELREDGRLYLTINGENIDITDSCSYETPYVYECTGGDGLRHTFIIGGELDDIGWVEYAYDDNGDTAISSTVLSIRDGVEPAALPWLAEGLARTMNGGVRLEIEDGSIKGNYNYFEIEVSDSEQTETGYGSVTVTENEK